jgi:hypothetical protein
MYFYISVQLYLININPINIGSDLTQTAAYSTETFSTQPFQIETQTTPSTISATEKIFDVDKSHSTNLKF